MNIELSGEFCFSEGPRLTWSDLRFGMSRGYISAKGVVEFATDSLTVTSDKNHYDLAAMSGADRWDVDGCLERLELLAGPDIDDRKDRWLYLMLLWVYNNQLLYDDPLSLAEDINAEFDYPECMAPMIRYMPSDHDDMGGDEKLMGNWKRLLVRYAEAFVSGGDIE